MALATTNISINDIHAAAGGSTNTEASLNDSDIRSWGNLYNVHSVNPSYNVGAAGISTTSGSEIAIGEFRGGVVPPANTAFQGPFTHRYAGFSGGQYAPSTVQDATSSFSNQFFTGTLMNVIGTHQINSFINQGISGSRGIITMNISSPTATPGSAYTNGGWTNVTFTKHGGQQLSLLRTDATFSASTSGNINTAVYTWGSAGQSFQYTNGYAYTDYFGGVNAVVNTQFVDTTGNFQITI